MSQEVRALVDKTWSKEAFNQEQAFEAACVKATSALSECRRQDDGAGANRWMECLMQARHSTAEPFASIYALHLATASVTTAEWLVCRHQYQAAVDVAARSWLALDAKDAKGSAGSLPSVCANESRWRLLGVLANIKWRVPIGNFRDVVVTPLLQVQMWVRYAQSLQLELDQVGSPDSSWEEDQLRRTEQRRQAESLLWSGLWTACCAYRYCRGELLRLTRDFNVLHRKIYGGAGLAMAERQWADGAPLAPDSPMYWQFEIVKQWLSEQKLAPAGSQRAAAITLDDAEHLYSRLLLSVERPNTARPDKAAIAGLKLDCSWMLGEIRAQSTLVVPTMRETRGGAAPAFG